MKPAWDQNTKGWGYNSEVMHLPNIHKALGQTPSTLEPAMVVTHANNTSIWEVEKGG